jgi:hypothetical protein
MPFSTRQVRQGMTRKLGFEFDAAASHPIFAYRHGGRIVAKTHISHGAGGRIVSEGIIAAMARQIGVQAPQLRAAINCTLSPEAFRQLLISNRP